jgi:hypothetical protein
VTLCAISTTFQMDHEPSPLVKMQGQYTKKISQLLESYQREDPPSKPKLAVPLSVPNYLVLAGLNSNDPKRRAVGNLATIAFHYLLRSGEYTFVSPKQRRQTKQFRYATSSSGKEIQSYHTHSCSRHCYGTQPKVHSISPTRKTANGHKQSTKKFQTHLLAQCMHLYGK